VAAVTVLVMEVGRRMRVLFPYPHPPATTEEEQEERRSGRCLGREPRGQQGS
jgi:hypothetical protein